MRLQDYEAKIEAYERLEVPQLTDGYGQRMHDSDAQEACYLLSSLSAEIRRMCWSNSVRDWAYQLAIRADQSADRIASENGMMRIGPARSPRWPALYSGGILHPAID